MEWYRPLPAVRATSSGRLATISTIRKPARWPRSTTPHRNSKEMLRNFYKKVWDSWQKGLDAAAVRLSHSCKIRAIPRASRKWSARLHGTAHRSRPRAESLIHLKEGNYPAGTYVVRLDQPYRNYAVDLLTPQHYPKDGEPALRRRFLGIACQLPSGGHSTADPSIRDVPLTTFERTAASRGTRFRLRPGLPVERHRPGIIAGGRYRLAKFRNSNCGARVRRATEPNFRPDRGFLPASLDCASAAESTAAELGLDFVQRRQPLPTCRITPRRLPALACGFHGPTPIPSDGSATRSISARSLTPICAMKTFAPGICARRIDVLLYGHVDLELAEQIEGLPKAWSPDAVQENCRRRPASALLPNPTTSPAASATKASAKFSISSTTAA